MTARKLRRRRACLCSSLFPLAICAVLVLRAFVPVRLFPFDPPEASLSVPCFSRRPSAPCAWSPFAARRDAARPPRAQPPSTHPPPRRRPPPPPPRDTHSRPLARPPPSAPSSAQQARDAPSRPASDAQVADDAESQLPPLRVYRDSAGGVQACAIPNVCYNHNIVKNHMYVPRAYGALSARIHECLRMRGWPKVKFYDPDAPPELLRAPLRAPQAVDLIGAPMRAQFFEHFGDFAPDFVIELAVPGALFAAPWRLGRGECVWAPAQRNGSAARVRECPRSLPALRPQLGVSDNVRGAAGGWVRAFYRLFDVGRAPFRLPAAVDARFPAPVCVRHVLVSPLSWDATRPALDGPLRAAGISRQPTLRSATCRAHVVVILRDRRHKRERTLPPALARRLRAELAARARGTHATLEVVVHLGARSLRAQAALMQRADVVVLVHGAELANAIFLRPGTVVVELMPFGYFQTLFDPVLRAVRARPVRLLAPPDPVRFEACLRQRRDMGRPLSPREIHLALGLFRRRAARFQHAPDERARLAAGRFFGKSFYPLQYCGRAQQILADPARIADTAFREAQLVCRRTLLDPPPTPAPPVDIL